MIKHTRFCYPRFHMFCRQSLVDEPRHCLAQCSRLGQCWTCSRDVVLLFLCKRFVRNSIFFKSCLSNSPLCQYHSQLFFRECSSVFDSGRIVKPGPGDLISICFFKLRFHICCCTSGCRCTVTVCWIWVIVGHTNEMCILFFDNVRNNMFGSHVLQTLNVSTVSLAFS